MNFQRALSFQLFFSFTILLFAQDIPDGKWIGNLDYGETNCPFRFEIAKSGLEMILVNGDERELFLIEKQGDSLFIPLKPFDAFISAKYSDGQLYGTWNKPYRELIIPFVAVQNQEIVNSDNAESKMKWKMTFEPGGRGEYPGVGQFKKTGSKVTGTILTETGDYRYFEGSSAGDSMKLSAFDGAHGFVMVAKKNIEGWLGKLYFEPGYNENWTAVKDENAEISDPFEMVEVEPNTHIPYYDLLGAGSGKNSIDASKYEGKVLIIQVFGTWCPNSLDQTNYLLDWYPNRSKDVEILAVAYEPNYSREYGLSRIKEYTNHLRIPYDVVLGGPLSKSQAALPFPFIQKLEAFPTLILVDRKGYARYVHSYFNGPATEDMYSDFKNQFNEKIDELIAE